MVFIICGRLITMNLLLGSAIELFFEAKRETDAPIKQEQIEGFVRLWSIYDPTGSGFMTPEEYGFLINELPVPLGLKDDMNKLTFASSTCNRPHDHTML
jgi:hypothetical protein